MIDSRRFTWFALGMLMALGAGIVALILLQGGPGDDMLRTGDGDVAPDSRGVETPGHATPPQPLPNPGPIPDGSESVDPGGQGSSHGAGRAQDDGKTPPPGTLCGFVVNARTDKPVPSATVSAAGPTGSNATTKTDGAGRFDLKGLAAGSYQLAVSCPGYEDLAVAEMPLPSDQGAHAGRLRLAPKAVLKGTVFDLQDRPVKGALVRLSEDLTIKFGPGVDLMKVFEKLAVPDEILASVTTGADGTFTVYAGDVPEGEYLVRADAQGLATGFVHEVTLSPSNPVRELEIRLEKPFRLEGRVEDGTGAGLDGATVVLLAQPRDERAMRMKVQFDKSWTRSDEDGGFEFDGLRRGRYVAIATREGLSMSVEDSVSIPRDDPLRLVLRLGFSLKGRVIDDATGQPVAGARIMAMGSGGGGLGQGETAPDGTFELAHLAPGRYQIMIQARGYNAVEDRIEGTEGVPVEKEFRLKGGVTVTGRVLDSVTRKPIEGVTIMNLAFGQAAMFGGGIRKTVTGADGAFTLDGIPPQDGFVPGIREERDGPRNPKVVLAAQKAGWLLKDYVTRDIPPGMDRVDNVEILLIPAPRLNVTVRDKRGAPVGKAMVLPVGQRDLTTELLLYFGGIAGIPRSGPEGEIAIDLPLGEEVHLIVHHPDHAMAVKKIGAVAAGMAAKDLDIRLDDGGTVQGVVLDGAGIPIARVNVVFESAGDDREVLRHLSYMPGPAAELVPRTTTDRKGRFSMAHLAPGSWRVEVSLPDDDDTHTETVAIREGETTNVRILMTEGLTISGFVSDENGVPVSDVHVSASQLEGDDQGWTTTEDDGTFTIKKLEEGTYRLHVYHPDFKQGMKSGVASGAAGVRIVLSRK